MQYYKLESSLDNVKFYPADIEFILKNKFNAYKLDERIIQNSTNLEKILQVQYRINDKQILDVIRTQDEKRITKERINTYKKQDMQFSLRDIGEEYIITLGFSEEDNLINIALIGDLCKYIFEETLILQGNDFRSQCKAMLVREPLDIHEQEVLEVFLKECNDNYIDLLKKHRYID